MFSNMNGFGGGADAFGGIGGNASGSRRPGGIHGGMPGGFSGFEDGMGRGGPSGHKPEDIIRPLKLSLEELYTGTAKHLKVARRLRSGGTQDKVLDITVQPGWKSGTKVRFPGAGNEMADPSTPSADLVFVVEEKPHPKFSREGNDLIWKANLSLAAALTGRKDPSKKLFATSLDGRQVEISVPSGIIKPGTETRVKGEGMPIRQDGASTKKGDLIVRWDVTFPTSLTTEQKEELRRILG